MSFHVSHYIKKPYKSHRCEWCHERVLTTESCYKSAGNYCGDFYSYYMHEECHTACCKYMENSDEYELPTDTMIRGGTEPK
jgi:hypothetical protein